MSALTRKAPRGFTLIELLVVIAIVGILSLICYPAISRLVPNQRVSSEAKQVDAVMQKARLRAATAQRPVRVVLNCSASPCWVELQAAVYTLASVTSWAAEPGSRHFFAEGVAIANWSADYEFDGASAAPLGVRYAIFMPDSRVFSDPRPFDLFFYHGTQTEPDKNGWRLTVGSDSGRVNTRRETLTVASTPPGPPIP
ncbi:MAG: prepilin-type N-terminal cleavage/methylation domain-containing protein [Deltaproteobacteria bacterium]|jgi:prepilin-type N-terminal cleavage/methylation domain-containing protein|nr:prepilin-type N-terminal cleavage/methylation domain-containing protein [Deltaproteobacteria bacterium]